jgi:hypothetical protein
MKTTLSLIGLGIALCSYAQTEMTIAELQVPGIFGPDSAGTVGDLVTVEGVALSSSEHFYSGSHSSFYLIDPEGGDYSGVLVYHPDPDVFDVYVGDMLRITGTVAEYATSSDGIESNMTELVPSDPNDPELFDTIDWEIPLPDPVMVDMYVLDPIRHNEHLAENIEGMLVEIHNAVVVDISAPPNWRQFTVADPDGNQAVIRTAAADLSDYGRPPLGASFELIKGVIYDVYANYNVMPRSSSDLVLAVGPPVISGTEIGPCGATPADLISITTNVSDDTFVDEAFVYYRANGGAWQGPFDMSRNPDSPVGFMADLPAQPDGTLLEIYLQAFDDADPANESFAPAEGPDAESFPALYVSGGTVTSCNEIQSSTFADGSTYYQCHVAELTGYISAGTTDLGFTEEDTFRNFIFTDADGEYGAIYIYNAQNHDIWLGDLERGDQISITGEITEYNGLTELTYITAFELLSSENDVNATALALNDFHSDAEPWESVLVELSDVSVIEDAGFGEWLIADGSGEQIVMDNLGSYDLEIAAGSTADALRGFITYSYGAWKIAPRANDDFDNFSDIDEQLVASFELLANYPNPFNPVTMISFNLDMLSDVELSIFNLLGEKVATLHSGYLTPGTHEFSFDASELASGTYFAKLSTQNEQQQQKMLLIK